MHTDKQTLEELAQLWEESAKVCEMVQITGWRQERAAYLECAEQLREIIAGNKDCLEEI